MPRTYGSVKLQRVSGRDTWVVNCEPHVRIRLKRVFQRIEENSRGAVYLTHTDENCRELEWFLERFPMDVDPAGEMQRAADSHRRLGEKVRSIIEGHYTPPVMDLALPLREYQKIPPAIVLENGALLLADVLGLGKTVQGMAMFTDTRTLPALVVTMTHLTRQWQSELQKFLPGLAVHEIAKGSPYSIEDFIARRRNRPAVRQGGLFSRFPDVLIVNYHKLAGWAGVLSGVVKSVVFDECQELRHSGTGRYQAATQVRSAASYCIGLTATPIYNYGIEIFNVLNVVKPDCLGTQQEFIREWCSQDYEERKIKIVDPRAFGVYVRDAGLMLRRTRAEVGRELPPVQRQTITVDADTSVLEHAADAASELARIILNRGEVYRGQKMHASEELSNLVRQATGIAKAPFVADFVRFLIESSEEPVLLAGWHRAVYDIWLHRLNDLKPVMYTGSESPTQKEEAKRKFVTGETKLMIISLRSGAGLDGLQDVCHNVVAGELDWSPGVHRQLIGRLHRDGQDESVNAYFLVADHGSDPIVVDVLGLKTEQQDGIEDPHGNFVQEMVRSDDHIERLARKYLRQSIEEGIA